MTHDELLEFWWNKRIDALENRLIKLEKFQKELNHKSATGGSASGIADENAAPATDLTFFTDPRDGETYRTVKIGSQIWMAENLRYKAEGSKCYDNDESNAVKYGRLYDWETAMKAAPKGWHLPSYAEWQELIDFCGGKVAKKLKAKSRWKNNGNGTDDYGFSALPGGGGSSGGSFYFVGYYGYWWSATEIDANYAWSRNMYYDYADVNRYSDDKSLFFSVRCVRDIPKPTKPIREMSQLDRIEQMLCQLLAKEERT